MVMRMDHRASPRAPDDSCLPFFPSGIQHVEHFAGAKGECRPEEAASQEEEQHEVFPASIDISIQPDELVYFECSP